MAYLPHTDADRREMLAALGLRDVEELFAEVPPEVRLGRPLDLPPALAEPEALALLRRLAACNADPDRHACFLGGGAYDHHVPAAVVHLLSRGEFLTSYTPYQAEISQGTLQAIYEFQSLVCALTGLDAANASLYDGASALAEAALLACRATGRRRLLVSATVNPAYRQVLRTYAAGPGLPVEEVPAREGVTDTGALAAALARGEPAAAVLLQEPNFFGALEPVREASDLARRQGALFVASVDPVSLGLLAPPGEYGADVAVGEGQALGCGLSFGGPYLGFMAVREAYLRQLPGRVVGATVDARGRRGFTLTLQAREQHIRRERATSNICTNQALMALAATIHLSLLGPAGLRRLGELCLEKAHYAAERLTAVPGVSLAWERPFFKEFALRLPRPAREVRAALAARGFLVGPVAPAEGEDLLLVAVTEKRTRAEIDGLAAALEEVCR